MTHQYIIINDIKQNMEYVYNSVPIDVIQIDEEYKLCVDDLQKKHIGELLQTKRNEKNNNLIVFSEIVYTNKGYFWTTTERRKTILYELRTINLFQLPYEYQTTENESSELRESSDSYNTQDTCETQNTNIIQEKSLFTVGTGYANSLLSPFGNKNLKVYN